VAADRHYETQAAIVRILKARKSIKHAELVAEVLQATKSRGALDPADIKKNIEKYVYSISPSGEILLTFDLGCLRRIIWRGKRGRIVIDILHRKRTRAKWHGSA
jgi:hypothetical protein